MIGRIDAWVGKTLFVPVIIRICQAAGITQYRFHWIIWASVNWLSVWRMEWLGWKITSACMAVLFTWIIFNNGDYPQQQRPWLRLFMLFCWASATLARSLDDAVYHVVFALVLSAEYALTIKTIPPLEAEKRELAKEAA